MQILFNCTWVVVFLELLLDCYVHLCKGAVFLQYCQRVFNVGEGGKLPSNVSTSPCFPVLLSTQGDFSR